MPICTHAIVRGVPDSFAAAIRPEGSTGGDIDVALARVQHERYVDALERTGVTVERVEADEDFPDCCFVEDPVVVVENAAFLCRMAAPSRNGEGKALERLLRHRRPLWRMQAPATMDGGDVIRVGRRLFVGLSARTNAEAIQQLRYSLGDEYRVTPVEVRGVLHLKSACTPVDDTTLLADARCVDLRAFEDAGFRIVEAVPGEGYAANCLAVNGAVLMSAGFPRTRDRVTGAGFDVVELDMSEFRKAGGSLTCLSVLL